MQYGDAISILRGIPLFCKLDTTKLKLLAFSSSYLTFEAGEDLVTQGDHADGAYLIEQGTVDIIAISADAEVKVGSLGRHELFGEMAILMNQPRTATIRAAEPVKVLKIEAEIFLRLVSENPETALSVMRSLSERLAIMTTRYLDLERRFEAISGTAASDG